MLRRFLSVLAAVSVVAFLAVCVAWYRTALVPAALTIGHLRVVSTGAELRVGAGLRCDYLSMLFALGVPPGLWFLIRFGKRGFPPGVCRSCGYDLRASTDRCPECGTPVSREGEPQ